MSIEEIREKYGDEVADKVSEEIEYANTKEQPFNIFVEQEGDHIHQIYFATQCWVKIFEVSVKRKKIFSDGLKTMYFLEAKKALELMGAFRQAE